MATVLQKQVHSLNSPMKPRQRLFSDPNDKSFTSTFEITNEDNTLEAGYYLHKKSLGEGGFGKVRLATHLRTNLKVAIKMMNKEKLGQDLQRVRIEVEALKVLQHENIAKMLQVIETDTDIYLVLEYCSGGELFDYLIAKRRLTETEVRVIMKDLFKVLLYIHNRGFAHRDLKPENILFDENHRIKLIDFGLAANSSKNKAALAFLQTCCGSPAYAAPELLKGLTYSGPAIDVWSAGVLLYSLLVGQLPFDDDNVNNLYKKIQIGRYLMPQWLSADVRDLIQSMLKTNPADRISVAKALDHRWIKKGLIAPSSPKNVLSPQSPNAIDPKAFSCCRLLFPRLSEQELKDRLNQFGYVTSTYLLLKNNPQAIKEVHTSLQLKMKPLVQQQQQLQFTNDNNRQVSTRVMAIKRKLQLDCDKQPNNSEPLKDQNSSPAKKAREIVETPSVTTTIPRNVIPQVKNAPLAPVCQVTPTNTNLPPLLAERKQMLQKATVSKPGHTPYPAPRTPTRMTAKTARKIISPKMKTAVNKKMINDENKQIPTTVKSPLAAQQNLIKSPLREVHNQVLSPIKTLNSPVQKTPTTPNTMVTPVKNGQKQLPLTNGNMTAKKTLLQRLMASATPAKSNSPRKLDANTPHNNITMTSFKDPQECIDRLTETLRSKGVECKQKAFSLKCFYDDKIHSALKFDLEICRFNGLCVIHRKRLKGDAWNYKKICELILQLSNEEQLAALNKQPSSASSNDTSSNASTSESNV